MAEFPGFTLWTDAYLADTSHLGMAEHGAYLMLLVSMWRAGGYLPNDDKKLCRFARATETQWMKVKPVIMEFFTVVGDEITQARLMAELEKARSRSKKASENAKAKYRKTNDVGKAGAPNPQSKNDASISTSISTDKKEPSVPKKGTRIPDDFTPDLDAAVTLGLRPEVAIVEAAKFKDYWKAAAGAKGVKLDWPATWRNWVRSALQRQGARGSPSQGRPTFRDHQDAVRENFERAAGYGRSSGDEQQSTFDLGREDFSRD